MAERFIVKCPDCETKIEVDSFYDIGDELECHSCSAQLEVVGVDPLKVKVVRSFESSDDNYSGDSDDKDDLDWEG